MPHIQFDAKVWKQGSSLILTIPKEIKNHYNLKEGEIMRISAGLIDEKEQKEEAELRKLRASYPYMGEGVIIHENEEIAKLHQVFFRIMEFKVGFSHGSPIKNLREKKVVSGVINRGIFLHVAYDKKHYGHDFLRDPYFKQHLMGIEKIKLKTSDNKKITLNNLKFEEDIVKKESPVISKVKFYGDLEID